ncbi:MAG: VanZ family protein [Slackia sp.]|nr:VanZ family protein [Slackia sp.]
MALSWAVVAAIALLVFFMSAKDGTTLDTGSGLLSAAKQALAGALSSIAGKPVDVSPIGHFVEYFALGAALANALRFHMPLRRACVWAGIAASLYGISDEIHQAFVPLRSCDPLDWAVDTVAAAIGAAVLATLVARGTNGARKPGERPLMKHDEADRKSGIPHRPR